jgi:hypothetical protein
METGSKTSLCATQLRVNGVTVSVTVNDPDTPRLRQRSAPRVIIMLWDAPERGEGIVRF